MNLSLIFSSTRDHLIGCEWYDGETINQEVFQNSEDREHFKLVTTYTPKPDKNLLIVGRKTWESLPPTMRRCRRRFYIILSGQWDYQLKEPNALLRHSFHDALQYANENRHCYYKIFVIGGREIYQQAIETGLVTEIYWTQYDADFRSQITNPSTKVVTWSCDLAQSGFRCQSTSIWDEVFLCGGKNQIIKIATNINFIYAVKECFPFELQYLSLVKKIVEEGTKKETRNGLTLSLNDQMIKIDLADGFPILTVRKSFWTGIREELLWFLSGSTNVKTLQAKGVNIWNANSRREFLDKNGLSHLSENDIGPSYGFQFRHAGASYLGSEVDYHDIGIDQLQHCVDTIKNHPNDRRIIISLWDVPHLNEMALPPCALLYQFTVSEGRLSCHFYQRSYDILVAWNISTAALLTHLLAHYCDLKPGYLTQSIGDVHIYQQHLDAYHEIIHRIPFRLPRLEIRGDKPSKIDGYLSENLQLVNYQHHGSVKLTMIP